MENDTIKDQFVLEIKRAKEKMLEINEIRDYFLFLKNCKKRTRKNKLRKILGTCSSWFMVWGMAGSICFIYSRNYHCFILFGLIYLILGSFRWLSFEQLLDTSHISREDYNIADYFKSIIKEKSNLILINEISLDSMSYIKDIVIDLVYSDISQFEPIHKSTISDFLQKPITLYPETPSVYDYIATEFYQENKNAFYFSCVLRILGRSKRHKTQSKILEVIFYDNLDYKASIDYR